MIEYTSSKQKAVSDFFLPFSGKLSEDNPWVKLAQCLPWDNLITTYTKVMSKKMGRRAVSPRVAIGAMIIKHKKSLSDEATVQEIKENPYLQYFLGQPEYQYKQMFASSLFVAIRKRVNYDELLDKFIGHVIEVEEKNTQKKAEDKDENDNDQNESNSNKGHLIVDASVAPSDIKYPTDLDLLNDTRLKSEQIIDLLYTPFPGKIKPRTYREKANKLYLSATRKRKKQKRIIRKSLKEQLNFIRRNFNTIENLIDEKGLEEFPLSAKWQRTYWIIQEVYRQQKYMYDNHLHKIDERIVSISQPHVRPMVRGKSGRNVEFGAKISVSLINGYSHLDKISFTPYNEGQDLIEQIERYKKKYHVYPEWVSADKIYGNRENRRYMKERGIKYTGSKLGRRKQVENVDKTEEKERKKKSRQRSQVEGSFGLGKRKYNLDLVKAKLSETSESWIGMVYLIMNIDRYLRFIFLSFLRKLKKPEKKLTFYYNPSLNEPILS